MHDAMDVDSATKMIRTKIKHQRKRKISFVTDRIFFVLRVPENFVQHAAP